MTFFSNLQLRGFRSGVWLGIVGPMILGNSSAALPQDRNVSSQAEESSEQMEKQFTPAMRTLLAAAGVDPKSYLRDDRITAIYGIQGIFSVSCKLRKQDVDGIRRCTQFGMDFRANIPVTRCVSFDQGDAYLLSHGWHHVDLSPPPGGYDLLPTERIYEDAAGASIALGPWIRNGCLTLATMTTPGE